MPRQLHFGIPWKLFEAIASALQLCIQHFTHYLEKHAFLILWFKHHSLKTLLFLHIWLVSLDSCNTAHLDVQLRRIGHIPGRIGRFGAWVLGFSVLYYLSLGMKSITSRHKTTCANNLLASVTKLQESGHQQGCDVVASFLAQVLTKYTFKQGYRGLKVLRLWWIYCMLHTWSRLDSKHDSVHNYQQTWCCPDFLDWL